METAGRTPPGYPWRRLLDSCSQSVGLVFSEKRYDLQFITSIPERFTNLRLSLKKCDWLSKLPGGILWDTNSVRDPKEAEIVQPEEVLRNDDDNFLGEANSHFTVVELPPNLQLSRYRFLRNLVESYEIIILRGMVIGGLLLFSFRGLAYMSTPLTSEGGAINGIVENVSKVLEYVPTERTENSRDKFTEFPRGANHESSSSDAKTNSDLIERDCSCSPMDGKVKPTNTQVFISFGGEQLRNSFIGHLVAALRASGINIFIDNQDQRGEDLNILFKRIEDSGIAIVVFSSRYTESRWCLDELVKIQERVHQGLLKVLPVYYKVTPTNVKRLRGEFGDHFRDKVYLYKSDGPKVKRWKEAIVFVSHLLGRVLDEESDEFSFINRIVTEVKIIEKSLDRLSEQQDDVFMDYPSSEDLEGLDGGRDGILWNKKSNRYPKEAEIVQPEAKSRRDDGLDPSKGETNSSSTVVKLPPNHQMLSYGFLSHLVKILESYKIISQLGIIIGFLLLLFFCLQQVAYMMSNPFTGEGGVINGILENVPNVLESIPAERTENPRNKFTEFPTGKFGTKPESSSSDATTNANLIERTCSSSPMDGKVKPPNIQVFINFRGEQLRNNFVGYLVAALRGSGINVFIDNYEQRGEDLNTLFKRIEDSGIAIVVFSSRYTESKWCLDELVKIKEREHQGLLKVLPIFYKVTPGNVKRLKGEFGDNFRDKEYMFASDEHKIKRWKEAIVFVFPIKIKSIERSEKISDQK